MISAGPMPMPLSISRLEQLRDRTRKSATKFAKDFMAIPLPPSQRHIFLGALMYPGKLLWPLKRISIRTTANQNPSWHKGARSLRAISRPKDRPQCLPSQYSHSSEYLSLLSTNAGGSGSRPNKILPEQVREMLYFIGASETLADGYEVVHGMQGKVMGPAYPPNAKTHLHMKFQGYKSMISIHKSGLSREPPIPPSPSPALDPAYIYARRTCYAMVLSLIMVVGIISHPDCNLKTMALEIVKFFR